MLDPNKYFPIEPHALTWRLVEVACDLTECYKQLHDATLEERRCRQKVFVDATESSVAARERSADIASFAQWAAVQDIKTDIQDLTEERDLIRFLLELNLDAKPAS
jgi:hypothetical protein